MKVQELLKYIIKLGKEENDIILNSIINQFYSISPNTSITDYYSDEPIFAPDFIREFIIEAFYRQIHLDKSYYQAFVLLGYLYFELQKYHKCLSVEKKALEIIVNLQKTDSPWAEIANALVSTIDDKKSELKLLNKINLHINAINSNIPKEDFLLECPECGAYNPFFVKGCKECDNKFSRKIRKKAKKLKEERENERV
ncbi:MAG: hypothetical protein ACOC44_04155 [Promethearchaeia archaeon]